MYICLVTRNREIEAKIMESGLIIWFDPDRLEKKSFGVKFPTGLKNIGMSIDEKQADTQRDWHDQEDKSGLIDRDKERLRDKDFNKRLEMLEGLQDRLEILYGEEKAKNRRNRQKKMQGGPDKEAKKEEPLKSFSLDEAAGLGIEAKVGRENDYFVYELKIPLLRSKEHPFATGVNNGQSTLGIETAEASLEGNASGVGEMRKGMLRNEDELCLWGTIVFSSAN